MKSVLITGITCYIGSEIARRLVADGVEVSGIVREGSQLQRLSPFQDQLTLFKTDGSQGSVDDAVSKSNADVIIHLAGFYTWEHSPEQVAELIDANITFGTKILEAAKKCGIKRLINTGSHIQYYESETANPANLYGATKQAFVDILDYYGQFEGFDVLSLIIFETYGPRDWRKKLIQAIAEAQKNGNPLPMVAADPIMDFAYIDDVVDAYIHAAHLLGSHPETVKGKSFALSGGQRLPISELIKVFEEVSGRAITTEKRDDPSDLRRILNPWKGPGLPDWEPRVSLSEGIEIFLEDF